MLRSKNRNQDESDPGQAAPVFRLPREAFSIQITDAQYTTLADLVYRLCGINLGQSKRELLKARLAKRLRALGLRDIKSYMQLLENDQGSQELINFLDVITTNKTDFFREPQHFDFLTSDILPRLEGLCGRTGPLRIWSAACSTGEEPYTLAMILLQNRSLWSGRPASILASDISTQVLGHAQRGIYAGERVTGIPRQLVSTYFQKGLNKWEGHVRVRPELKALVSFRRINLMDPFNFPEPFQVIFCRNVMIYFDKPTQQKLVEKFRSVLQPGGFLFVGHSESLTGIEHRMSFVKPAVYRKDK